ncbi:PDZ domain [Trinorchestia longiramus]|nr:PDZ domain [Trinorchestia longiramus]
MKLLKSLLPSGGLPRATLAKTSNVDEARVPGCKKEDLELRPMRASIIPEDVRLTSTVTLHKKDNVTLGIVVAGGSDKGYRPRIARLRPGSAAHRCDKLAVGDYILAVNGCPTEDRPHQEIVALLRNAGNRVSIDIEYETPSLQRVSERSPKCSFSACVTEEEVSYGGKPEKPSCDLLE